MTALFEYSGYLFWIFQDAHIINRVFLKRMKSAISSFCRRLISVVDVVGPMNPYQPIPFNILSFDVFQSRILIYASSNISLMRYDFIHIDVFYIINIDVF